MLDLLRRLLRTFSFPNHNQLELIGCLVFLGISMLVRELALNLMTEGVKPWTQAAVPTEKDAH